jgi:methylthioribose-1-phosphate isomerase
MLQQTVRDLPPTIEWKAGELYLLDQTLLPLKTYLEKQTTAEDVWNAIYQLKVRGAPAIGAAAGYGLCVAIKDQQSLALDDFLLHIKTQVAYLDSSRPTAVNLGWALRRMLAHAEHCIAQQATLSSTELYAALVTEAKKIHSEDRLLCDSIGATGAPLIKEGMGLLTHCNAGALATSGIGTATAPMYTAHENGTRFRVYADETRPLLQGARLTAWELQKSGLDVTLITDNMAAHIMSKGLIDMVIVGTDRVAANGDVANKIGTLNVAILAQHYNIPFYVALPFSTIDLNTPTGNEIEIEERAADEVTHFGARRTAPENIQVRSPAFDITPHQFVTGFITDQGLITPPFNLAQQFVDCFPSSAKG